jgi:carboxyl-terminal processing protease
MHRFPASLIIAGILMSWCAYPAMSIEDSAFNSSVLKAVGALVQKHFYKVESLPAWNAARNSLWPKIILAKNLPELGHAMNEALASLHASHTQFVTTNDETYYFLKTLFARERQSTPPVRMDFTGAVTGGVDCKPNQVRYVLDGSPAAAVGVKPGDIIVSVDGAPYVGQSNFAGKAGKPVKLEIERRDVGKTQISVTPIEANDFEQYLAATKKSVGVTTHDGKRIGYIHVWCGGNAEHEIIEDALGGRVLQQTDALIFDLRDGYGGNYYNDLDYFYRPAAGFPLFKTIGRRGAHEDSAMFYDKPVVCLINGGSRSGKELVAYSLKQTHRATLVGERTAGYVLGGRLFPVNDRCALYLAVEGPTPDSVNLEGIGVTPDIEVKQTCDDRAEHDLQRDKAVELLLSKFRKSQD